MARIAMACIALLGLLVVACGTSKVEVGDTKAMGEIAEVAAGDAADASGPMETVEPAEGAGDAIASDACQPDCAGKECGDDGCGGSCGECGEGEECLLDWILEAMVCTGTCEALCDWGKKECGWIYPAGPHEEDGCFCGDCAEDEPYCTVTNKCSPHPQDEGELGWPCAEDKECLSGFCVDDASGKVCSMLCVEECPPDFACAQCIPCLPDQVYICLPNHARLCKPCLTDSDCNDALGDVGSRCVPLGGGGMFCGSDCSDSSCPQDYECHGMPLVDGKKADVCVREIEDGGYPCECSPLAIAESATTTCYQQNMYGKCSGERHCEEAGLTACDAKEPEPEECNGLDDDCDGEIDEGLPDYDGDGIPCEPDELDNDGVPDYMDNCPADHNPDQEDNDQDSMGDVCDPDDDNDQSLDDDDCAPLDPDIYPDAVETCDEIDNNCDGQVDEGCPCMPDCTDKECGDDGCGDDCGTCAEGTQCVDGTCEFPWWIDSETGLMWENPASGGKLKWDPAKDYCDNLGLGGYDDWYLPTIDELRTLIRGCPATETGGECNVSEGDCLSGNCMDPSCLGCALSEGPGIEGQYWPEELEGIGPMHVHWSATVKVPTGFTSTVSAWTVGPSKGSVMWQTAKSAWDSNMGAVHPFRCVR